MEKVIAIVGPTASGKTSISVELARAIGGEIVSADSRQVYRGLDIGSGKITKEEMKGVPHYMLDVADPKEIFSAAHYETDARKKISEILTRGHVPLVIGGSGFYIDALFGRIRLSEVPPNAKLRDDLKRKKTPELLALLEKLDKEKAATVDQNNPVRIIRAIEIAQVLGTVPMHAPENRYDVLWIGIDLPKEVLRENIHSRLLARIDAGMVEEAEKLHAQGLSYDRMEALGLEYRYLAWYLQGLLERDEMLKDLESEIDKYAKRQMTWFKKNENIRWFNPANGAGVITLSREFLRKP
jgi:tRNA dimethylallyltransferase